jgi:hypothetical protein
MCHPSFSFTEVLAMFRRFVLFTVGAFVFVSSDHAASLLMSLSDGNGIPMQFTVPHPISYTVTNDTPNLPLSLFSRM